VGDWTLIDTYTVDNIYLQPAGFITVDVTGKNWANGQDTILEKIPVNDIHTIYTIIFIDIITKQEMFSVEIASAEELTLALDIT